ncbi:hypothetical protein KUTeg_001063 [Tegillarca granosa]|uniref:Uncharacterized protein n=1 Tax=Tegillarca granosa TaxID=220873 RepID=A0ABQ9FVY3_TEGGR|nr:hypothetical protein KUTeg_001063 [Tegillarca granosa]
MTELKKRLQGEMTDLNQLIQQSEGKLENKNIGMVQFLTDVKRRMEKYRPCDPLDVACLPDFITRNVNDEELNDLFGQLDTKTVQTEQTPPVSKNRNILLTSPVIDAKIVGSFISDRTRVVTTGNDQAWLWNGGDNVISLVKSDGKVIRDINTNFELCDAAVSASGDLFVTALTGNKVKKLTNHRIFTDIYTAADCYETRGITVTDRENVLVLLFKYNDSK